MKKKNSAIVMFFALFIIPMLFAGNIYGTTEDGPAVVGKSSTNKELTVTFSREMDTSSVMSSLTARVVIPGVGYGTLSGEIKCEGTKAMFVSHSEFIVNLNYTLVITTGAKDMAGIPMDSEYTWSFVFSEQVVKTTRDDKGVWFITGPDNASLFDVFEAMGYAVATDRLWQAELYRRAARGRLAEILGSDHLESDILARTIGYSDQELENGFNALDSEAKKIVNGYVAGFNRRIAELAGDTSLVPFEFRALGFTPADWEVEDVLAWMAFLQKDFDPEASNQHQINNMALYASLAASFPAHFQDMFQDLRWLNDPDALTYIPKNASPRSASEKISGNSLSDISDSDIPDYKQTAANMSAFRSRVVQNLKKINAYVKMGSYAWTIAGTKTASGNQDSIREPDYLFRTPDGFFCPVYCA